MAAEWMRGRGWAPLGLGAVACLVLLATAVWLGPGGWRAWLAAAVMALSVPIGALGLSMMVTLIPGSWRASLADPFAELSRLMAPAALLFLPVLIGLPAIYPWVAEPQNTGFRAVYLAPWSFGARAVFILLLFGGLAVAIRRRGDATLAAVGLLAYVPLTTLAAVDWLLSLDPDFASSGFGLYVLCLQTMTALAVAAIEAVRRSPPRIDGVGAILLTALLLWAYFAFMQYFIVWSGNLPPGVAWYQRRGDGSWPILIWLAGIARLGPALLLIFPPARASRRAVLGAAIATVGGTTVEIAWLALPGTGSVALMLYALMVPAMGLTLCGASAWLRAERGAQ